MLVKGATGIRVPSEQILKNEHKKLLEYKYLPATMLIGIIKKEMG